MDRSPNMTARGLDDGPDLAACVERARHNDEEAARTLVRETYPMVIRIVRAHLPRRASEEDLAQTVYMKVFANLNQYSGRVPIQNWISRIAVNTCYNQLQAERIRPELRWSGLAEEDAFVLESLAASEGELAPSESIASRELVEKMLARLSPPERLVVTLLHLEEKSVAEISRITGWTRPMVKIRAFRARLKLRKLLKTLMEEHRA
jgi:RNA polymerase sigma-70 factor (ECF subfamily)